ncbi:MAG: DUF1697 domain-containing protein [Candidatus Saccharimonadales bacterium]
MTKYVAFLRGINVGGRVIKMADLAACCEKAGLNQVKTVLQTGNVVFESDKSEAELKRLLEDTLTSTFDYPAKVQVLSIPELQKIIDEYPFGEPKPNIHDYLIFIENELEQLLLAEKYELALGEKVAAGKGVIYWRVEKGLTLKSSFAKVLTKAKYKPFNTNRNLNTLKKIAAF